MLNLWRNVCAVLYLGLAVANAQFNGACNGSGFTVACGGTSSAPATPLGDTYLEIASTSGDTTPDFTLGWSFVLQAGDKLYIEKSSGVSLNLDGVGYHTITAPEAAGATITFSFTPLTSGTYAFRQQIVRGAAMSNWSEPPVAWVIP